jgi:hypothetical protein
MDVCEIAAAPAGDQDFLARPIGKFEDGGATAAFAGFHGTEETGGARSED